MLQLRAERAALRRQEELAEKRRELDERERDIEAKIAAEKQRKQASC